MHWFVYRYDFNARQIVRYDIFQHGGFYEDFKKLKAKKLPKDRFAEELRKDLMYYFWSKCEHEVVVTSWPPHIDEKEIKRIVSGADGQRYLSINPDVAVKIDVFTQLTMNWDVFVDYVYGG